MSHFVGQEGEIVTFILFETNVALCIFLHRPMGFFTGLCLCGAMCIEDQDPSCSTLSGCMTLSKLFSPQLTFSVKPVICKMRRMILTFRTGGSSC